MYSFSDFATASLYFFEVNPDVNVFFNQKFKIQGKSAKATNSLIKAQIQTDSLKRHLKCWTIQKHTLPTTTFSLQFDHIVTASKNDFKNNFLYYEVRCCSMYKIIFFCQS